MQLWVRKYGREHVLPKVVRVESTGEKDRIEALQKRVTPWDSHPKSANTPVV
ncbi:MAG: hypothetical protein Kow001_19960 [Acidobacteriota bacterium]